MAMVGSKQEKLGQPSIKGLMWQLYVKMKQVYIACNGFVVSLFHFRIPKETDWLRDWSHRVGICKIQFLQKGRFFRCAIQLWTIDTSYYYLKLTFVGLIYYINQCYLRLQLLTKPWYCLPHYAIQSEHQASSAIQVTSP